MLKKVSIALAIFSLSAAASAQGYGVVSVGSSKFSLDCSGATTCDKSDTAYKLLGGYKLNPNLAVEAGFFDFGKARASDATTSATIKVSAVGGGVAWHQDLAPDWNFVGRLGLAQVKTKIGGTLGSVSDSDNSVQPYVGLGVGYKLSKNMSLDLAWDASRGKYDKNGLNESGNVNAVSVGMTFGF